MRSLRPLSLVPLSLAAALLTACGSLMPDPAATPAADHPPAIYTVTPDGSAATPAPAAGTVSVEAVAVVLSQGWPVSAEVQIRGTRPDPCASIDASPATRSGATFHLQLSLRRAADEVCAQALTPFQMALPLDVLNLPAGTYAVTVNGLSDTFTLAQDNVAGEETPAAPPSGLIAGYIWHDICANGQPASNRPPDGCVISSVTGLQGDGVWQAGEPTLAGLHVSLGAGPCPSTGLAEAVTGPGDVGFVFSHLPAGDYCVSVDPQAAGNAAGLLPGQWTYPISGAGPAAVTVSVIAGEARRHINFAWDFQRLPVESHGDGPCTYRATYLADVTIPDDAVLAPGLAFTKTWRVRNDGTCTWGQDYIVNTLSRVGGTALGAPDSVTLPRDVPPGDTVELSVPMRAPDLAGVYRSEWQLIGTGVALGVGASNTPLYVQFAVSATATPAPARITFASGAISSSVQGAVTAPARTAYVLRALKGQQMTVEVISAEGRANFAVTGADGQPLKRLENEDRRWTGTLPASQDYQITVAVASGSATFTLVVTAVTP